MRRVLFLCSRNRLRSPTAEQLFAGRRDLEVASAGLRARSTLTESGYAVERAPSLCLQRHLCRRADALMCRRCLSPDADVACTAELVAWADIIFVMEKRHRVKLARNFGRHTKRARVICLDIPDRYAFMAADLVRLLHAKIAPHLPVSRG